MSRHRLLLLVGTLLVACFPAMARAQTTSAPTASSAKTGVIFFAPFTSQGLNSDVKVSKTLTGSCDNPSNVDANRSDAWACTAGGATYDPCFASDDQTQVACPNLPSPSTADVSGGSVLTVNIIQLSTPPETALANLPGATPTPFLVQLADGEFCNFEPQDVRFNGLELFGYCTSGYWVGPPDMSKPVWTFPILQRGASASMYSIQTINAIQVWY